MIPKKRITITPNLGFQGRSKEYNIALNVVTVTLVVSLLLSITYKIPLRSVFVLFFSIELFIFGTILLIIGFKGWGFQVMSSNFKFINPKRVTKFQRGYLFFSAIIGLVISLLLLINI